MNYLETLVKNWIEDHNPTDKDSVILRWNLEIYFNKHSR